MGTTSQLMITIATQRLVQLHIQELVVTKGIKAVNILTMISLGNLWLLQYNVHTQCCLKQDSIIQYIWAYW